MTVPLDQLLPALAKRAAYATVNRAGFNSEPLRRHLLRALAMPPGHPDSFLADPVIEGAFGWQMAGETLGELTDTVLQPTLVDVLDDTRPVRPDERPERSRFPRDRQPYLHQVEAWRRLSEEPARSVLVSSGTGSGKTECFLIPILNDLARQRLRQGRLSGVQALFLYPLNALINSQRDRLTDWTDGFQGDIRFCLYNGTTPDSVPADRQRRYRSEVLSRTELRTDPPSIVVTNITMLEYLLIRPIDAPIITRSQGRLRWIVLDEAHTYLGSQAAELALLLRRVLRAFGVEADQVRFVATSATIGEGDQAAGRLRRFLADLAGVPEERVTIIQGRRDLPPLPTRSVDQPIPPLSTLANLTPTETAQRLAAAPTFRHLRDDLAHKPQTLQRVSEILGDGLDKPRDRLETLALLELASKAGWDGQTSLLPLRMHLFHRTQPGLWACANSLCAGRAGTALDDPLWPFGRVFVHEAERCPSCDGPVLEIVGCDHCGYPFLVAEVTDEGHLRPWRLRAPPDDFAQEIETDTDDLAEAEDEEPPSQGSKMLITPPGSKRCRAESYDGGTGRLLDNHDPAAIQVHLARADQCPACDGTGRRGGEFLRSARFGAPFLLGTIVPHLLDSIEPRPNGRHLPAEGRQLITFTDSRQGTARFSAKLQQDAERTFIRSALYHMVQERGENPAEQQDLARLLQELANLEPWKDALRPTYERLKKDIERIRAPKTVSIPWEKVCSQIASLQDVDYWMADLWAIWDSRFTRRTLIAEIQLYREFLRRPRRQNSAETMGLAALRFPAIDGLREAPKPFTECGLGLQDWKDYLHVLTGYFIRANSAVAVPREHRRWIGLLGPTRKIRPPNEPADRAAFELSWPAARRRTPAGRPVRLLQTALRLNLSEAADRDRIDECLYAAWLVLNTLRAATDNDFQLDLTKAHLTRVEAAWFCPVTRRVLDCCFAGLTPYQPANQSAPVQKAEPIRMPQIPYPWNRRDGFPVPPLEIRAWLAQEPQVLVLRDRGVWSDLHDRIVAIAPYVRAAEHSAQQSPARLQQYERDFKAGKINVLNCSTTMEMGVDIGGITGVVMTNVPPTPSNYRQRVGRAGRRGETMAFGLTLCTDTPLGWTVFRRPTWPFDQDVRSPTVALDSAVIVQRHVNALLLSAFLRTVSPGTNPLTLEAGTFFEPDDRDGPTPSRRFMEWCSVAAGLPPAVVADLRAVVALTCLDGQDHLPQATASLMDEVDQAWRAESQTLKDDLATIAARAASPRKAAEIRLRRLRETYLLSDLARRGFLPGYGFPSDVVPFVNLTMSQIDQRKSTARDEKEGLDGDRFRTFGFPSRQLDLAIRDYAPGTDVVLDGLVYRSGGVTLNWKRPASGAAGAEIQALGYAWHCPQCGATDAGMTKPALCGACGSDRLGKVLPFLRPAGFTNDIRDEPHTNIEQTAYVPPREPWISVRDGTWTALADPTVGRYRVSRQGHVFHFTLGANDHCYAVCLQCGRAAEEATDGPGPLPVAMNGHRPLRGTGGADGQCRAADNPFGVRRNLALGYGFTTDVFELQLTGIADRTIATSLAVALREALAQLSGIEAAELGWASLPARDGSGGAGWSLLVYDRASGGAGFASSAGTMIGELLKDAARVLSCGNPDCVRACHACLLSRDTQFDDDKLDRIAAKTFLETRVLAGLALPLSLRYFGPASHAEGRPLSEALDHALHRRPGAVLRLWLGGPPRLWDLFAWRALPLLEKWGGKGRALALIIEGAVLDTLTHDQRFALTRLLERCRARLVRTSTFPRAGSGVVIAQIQDVAETITWAASTETVRIPDAAWSADCLPLVCAAGPWTPTAPETPVGTATLSDGGAIASLVTVSTRLNGPIETFGEQFWTVILASKPDIGQIIQEAVPLTDILYQDRYLFSPLVIRLLYEALRPLLRGRPKTAERVILTVRTLERRTSPPTQIGRYLHHDWATPAHRDEVLRRVLERAVTRVDLETGDLRDLPHDRTLSLRWSNGRRVVLHLDQGFGYWETLRPVQFAFTARPEAQAQDVMKDFAVCNRSAFPMAIFALDAPET